MSKSLESAIQVLLENGLPEESEAVQNLLDRYDKVSQYAGRPMLVDSLRQQLFQLRHNQNRWKEEWKEGHERGIRKKIAELEDRIVMYKDTLTKVDARNNRQRRSLDSLHERISGTLDLLNEFRDGSWFQWVFRKKNIEAIWYRLVGSGEKFAYDCNLPKES